jgi:peptidoglycan/LPS O-acetylase OafA/YrhL
MIYRKDIDGLRAIALLPVLMFHAGFDAVGGGFVGVDVFFVISAYLITTLILNEKEASRP